MKFNDVASEAQELKRRLQDLRSAAYCVYPNSDNSYRFVAFIDTDAVKMGYTVLNADMIEMRLLSDLSVTTLVEFGRFVEAIEEWQTAGDAEFPFVSFLISESDFGEEEMGARDPTDYVPPDVKFDGEEAELK